MKPIKVFLICIFPVLLASCNHNPVPAKSELISHVKLTEKNFCKMAGDSGLQKAFLAFADSNVVLLRNDSLIRGKKQLKAFYKNFDHPDKSIRLVWKPDFVDVSRSGDLAYTYGTYTFSRRDEKGVLHTSTGIFHTIWKRQQDGSWKFVWD